MPLKELEPNGFTKGEEVLGKVFLGFGLYGRELFGVYALGVCIGAHLTARQQVRKIRAAVYAVRLFAVLQNVDNLSTFDFKTSPGAGLFPPAEQMLLYLLDGAGWGVLAEAQGLSTCRTQTKCLRLPRGRIVDGPPGFEDGLHLEVRGLGERPHPRNEKIYYVKKDGISHVRRHERDVLGANVREGENSRHALGLYRLEHSAPPGLGVKHGANVF